MPEDDRKQRALLLIGAILLSVVSVSLLLILWRGIDSLALFLVRTTPHSILSAMSSLWLLPMAVVLMAAPLFAWVRARKAN